MTRPLGPTPADDLGADLEPVWDRLADHADATPHARPELMTRVQGALLTEFDKALRPTAQRPAVLVRPLVRASSLRSLAAAAALVALLGVSVALAGAGVARLYDHHPVLPTPTPAVEAPTDNEPDRPAPIIQPPAQPGPDGIEDPGEKDNPDENVDQDGGGGTGGDETDGDDATKGDEDGTKPDEPGDGVETDDPDESPAPDEADAPDNEPPDSAHDPHETPEPDDTPEPDAPEDGSPD